MGEMFKLAVQLSGYGTWIACMEQETNMHQTNIYMFVKSRLRNR